MTLEAVNRLALTRGRHRITCYTSGRTPSKYIWLKVKSGKTIAFNCAGGGAAAKKEGPGVDWDTFLRNLKFSPNDNQTVKERAFDRGATKRGISGHPVLAPIGGEI